MAEVKEVVKVAAANTNTAPVYRIVIPKSIIAAARIEKGDQMVISWDEEKQQIIVKKF